MVNILCCRLECTLTNMHLFCLYHLWEYLGSSPWLSETSPQSFLFRLCPPLHTQTIPQSWTSGVMLCFFSVLSTLLWFNAAWCILASPEGPACLINNTFFYSSDNAATEILDPLLTDRGKEQSHCQDWGTFSFLVFKWFSGNASKLLWEECSLVRVSGQVSTPFAWSLCCLQ